MVFILEATDASISIANSSASTVASVIRKRTGVDLLQMPHMPMIEYVLRKSGSVIVAGTIPFLISRLAFLLKIDLPFSDFSPPYLSSLGFIFARVLMYSFAFSIFAGRNLSYGTRFGLQNPPRIGKPWLKKRLTVLLETIVPV